MPHCRNCGTKLTEEASYCYRCGTPVMPVKLVPSSNELPLRLAGCGDRFVAFIIDVIILSIILTPLKLLVLWKS
jgi:hypothetical protein